MAKPFEYYAEHIEWRARAKPDFTPLFVDPEVFGNLVRDLAGPFRKAGVTRVAAPEAMGFIIGSAVARHLKVGFVPIRKGGKLPTLKKYVVEASFVDYSREKHRFGMNINLVSPGDRILLVDDWIETGGQAKALVKLLERRGAEIVGISCLGFNRVKRTRRLSENYALHSILDYSDDSERDLNAPLAT